MRTENEVLMNIMGVDAIKISKATIKILEGVK
jgi:hypothetical protein